MTTPAKWEKEFDEKFIIPKGHFNQVGWENVEGKHLWGKYSQDGGAEIKSFISTTLSTLVKEFDKRFIYDFPDGRDWIGLAGPRENDVKSFIHQLLSDYKSRLLSEVEKEAYDYDGAGKVINLEDITVLIRKEN